MAMSEGVRTAWKALITRHRAPIRKALSATGEIKPYVGAPVVPPKELGNPAEWGVMEIKLEAPADSMGTMNACVNASGGEWCYGWFAVVEGKDCYSNYYHHTKVHKSSVKINGETDDSGWLAATRTANASEIGPGGATCYTYYSIK
ncbi:lactococcin 972 family bacteriocin [Streptomyces sp. CO7]